MEILDDDSSDETNEILKEFESFLENKKNEIDKSESTKNYYKFTIF